MQLNKNQEPKYVHLSVMKTYIRNNGTKMQQKNNSNYIIGQKKIYACLQFVTSGGGKLSLIKTEVCFATRR